ncbi:MAG: hypothetical protein RDU01_08190 [Thermodesulfovibrionales bacterium]|nr:hypothetical protein [Thermodesulfovibrionales bacterium]
MPQRMTFLILGLFLIFFPIVTAGTVFGEDWQYYADDSEGNFLYYDKDSIAHRDEVTEVLQKKIYERDNLFRIRQKLGEKYATLIEERSLLEIHCPKKTFQVRAVDSYRSDGNIIDHIYHKFLRDWKKVQPTSDMEHLYRICCKKKEKE